MLKCSKGVGPDGKSQRSDELLGLHVWSELDKSIRLSRLSERG